jgi:hypothetical protein
MDILYQPNTARKTHYKQRTPLLLGLLLLWHFSSNISCAQSYSPLKLKYNTTNTYPEFRTNDEKTENLINEAFIWLGTVEVPKGSNGGQDVMAMLASVGIYFEAPWCAANMGIICRNTCIPYPRSGFVPNWSRDIWQAKVVYDKRTAKRNLRADEVRRGDFCTIFYPNLRRDGHIFLVIGITENGSIISNEGNTNNNGSREGYMNCNRVRELWQVSKVIRLINN